MGAEQSKNDETSEIVVVNNEVPARVENENKEGGQKLTKLQPLLKHSASYGIVPSDHASLRHINPRNLTELLTIYEEHLRQSSAVVSEEQNAMSRSIRQTDNTVAQILGTTQKKHTVYNAWSNSIQTSVKDISAQLSSIQKTVDRMAPLVNELNELLPVDERMAPFTHQLDST